MEKHINTRLCPDYKRVRIDYDDILRDKNNPLDRNGYPLYPQLLSSSQGTSLTYKFDNDWFFKRKQQDGSAPLEIFSQHHHVLAYNEYAGSFDDLGEVLCYELSKTMIDPETGKQFIVIPEYKLAVYHDEKNIIQRGCISKNIITSPNMTLVSMTKILNACGIKTANTIDVYMSCLKEYCSYRNIKCDFEKARRDLIKNSYFCWKVANSDNHKNNITFIETKHADGTISIEVSPLIDNGSAYELSAPYYSNAGEESEPVIAKHLLDDEYSTENENGERVFSFKTYPLMHSAFNFPTDELLFEDTRINGKYFTYEYGLVSEMLADPELFRQVSEMEKQFDLDKAIDALNKQYGPDIKKDERALAWPPLLIEYMKETNACKSRTLSILLADYYAYAAYTQCISPMDKVNPTELYAQIFTEMANYPILENKEQYDAAFIKVTSELGVNIDPAKLKNLKFKATPEMKKPEQQPS